MEGLEKIGNNVWGIKKDYKECMNTGGRIYGDQAIISSLEQGAVDQCANVACLPGILKYSIAMPDIHYGYGFPIGGVAAFGLDDGVISPGGVGFDINCGVRLLRTDLDHKDIKSRIRDLIDSIFTNVPSGVGKGGKIRIDPGKLDPVFKNGAKWAVEKGYGIEDDLMCIEENGGMNSADPGMVSPLAKKRGAGQIGTLGSGNHFLEIQVVDEIFDEKVAGDFGITHKGQITVMVHSGSRGAGHQICTDYLKVMERASKKYEISIPDRQLSCAPFKSQEGQDYYKGMSSAVNYAFANRQAIAHWTRESFEQVLKKDFESLGMKTVYEVAHNIAKVEKHDVNGKEMDVVVHRKGATRSFGPGRMEIPGRYRNVGQPVIIPGDMGTASYLLVGTEKAMQETFGSTCHGAGRVMSRAAAKKKYYGEHVEKELLKKGIYVKAASRSGIAEEAPGVYKDISEVVKSVHDAGISCMVARMKPLGVVKG